MNSVTVVVTFLQGETTTFIDKPFFEVIQSIFSEKFEKLIPLKITFPKTGKLLYADKTVFMALLSDDISTEDAIKATQCDALCRNIEEIHDPETDVYIDPGALWKKYNNQVVLLDNDCFIRQYWNETLFKII
jgi:hypothetical protein